MANYHFIGIGGIGMSALAAMCRANGDTVTGSDRGYGQSANRRIFAPLESAGIKIFPQDGSFIKETKPDFLVWSSAIEEDNPDFVAGKGIPRLHRADLLRQMIGTFPGVSIAVTGSCGKSSVTAYLAEALDNLSLAPDCLNGALVKRFISSGNAGNYQRGAGKYFVFESDESDKSLLGYQADYAIVLNLGCDHYDTAELSRVFGTFLSRTKRGAVIEEHVFDAVKAYLPKELPVKVFGFGETCDYRLESYTVRDHRPYAKFAGMPEVALPQSGHHVALNALSVFAMLELLGVERSAALKSLEKFDGVWRRSDRHGTTANGAAIFDDYAHNPEKIRACLEAMREITPGRLFAVYQPHGYGPFGFMRDTLLEYLDADLQPGDRFYLCEPYYAGGTSSFKPTAKEVLADWEKRAKHPEFFRGVTSREALKGVLLADAEAGDTIVIMGARDNSLSDFAESFRKA